jgi:hypothetical protein
MRIIGKEIKKLFNIRLIGLLLLFTTVFMWAFLSMTYSYWNYSNSDYDVNLHRELIAEFGSQLTEDEWDAFIQKRIELASEFNTAINGNEILERNGIDTYEKFLEAYENISDDEKALSDEISRIIYSDYVTSPLFFKLQEMNDFVDLKGSTFFADKTQEEIFGDDKTKSEDYKKRYTESVNSDSVSLIHPAVTETVDSDFFRLIILSAVWCFIIIIPFQISESLKGVRDIQLSCKIGRKIFNIQSLVCGFIGLATGILLAFVYGIMLYRKGTFDFLNCIIIDKVCAVYWFDLTYGQYLLIYLLIFLLASISAAMLAYFIGRISINYITGLGISIPIATVFCLAVGKLANMPFYAETTVAGSFTKIAFLLVIYAICFLAVRIILKKDKVSDIL